MNQYVVTLISSDFMDKQFHDPTNKITKQLGDGKLLSQLTKKSCL